MSDVGQAQLFLTGLAHVSIVNCGSGRQHLWCCLGSLMRLGGTAGCPLSRVASTEMAGTTLLSFVFMLHLCSRLAWAYSQAVPVIFLWWSQRSKRGNRNKQAYFKALACVKFATVPLVKSSYTWKGIAKGQEHRKVWKDTGRYEKLEPLVKSIYCNNQRRVK